ncbi:hypothetical protein [Achromobacter marplatensis]|uniref:hypothetical protein n=1 Tax=Achromobacter marplatensis TaxID=470868 RepID=UPI003C74CB5B
MESQKLGPWHPEHVKPAHVGVYELDWGDADGRAFAKWDGYAWGFAVWEKFAGGTVNGAIKKAQKEPIAFLWQTRWRGVLR